MPLISHFHPLLVHFPIALILAAAAAELVVIATPGLEWRWVAASNVRAGAAIGLVAAITGWLLASSPIVDATPALEWHRWIGLAGALSAAGAALMSWRPHGQSRRSQFTYRVALFGAALLVAVAGHLGGTLVWGAGFLRP
jgi:uncharacterized membrane protein